LPQRDCEGLSAIVIIRWIKLGPTIAMIPLWRLLDAPEQARAGRFRFTGDRDAFVAAHALLRMMLSKEVGIAPSDWRFQVASGGKPQIDPSLGYPDLRFSLSHTRGMAACAVGRTYALGVDVEALNPALRPLEMAQRFFAAVEAELIGSLPAKQQLALFYRIWTLKEAYLKATGQGLNVPLDGFAFSFDPISISFPGIGSDQPDAWQFAEIQPGPEHTLAVAVRRDAAETIQVDPAAAGGTRFLFDADSWR
jgi:4'-phosphopantetheinyl transferase